MKTTNLDQARSVTPWTMAASGAWTIGAYIGANLIAIGLVLPLRGEASFTQGIVLAAAGAVLAVLGWRNAYRHMAALETERQEPTGAGRIANAALPSGAIAATA
ncbi:MAG: hypothetical protein U1F54_12790 [Burkholderiales bacterium]